MREEDLRSRPAGHTYSFDAGNTQIAFSFKVWTLMGEPVVDCTSALLSGDGRVGAREMRVGRWELGNGLVLPEEPVPAEVVAKVRLVRSVVAVPVTAGGRRLGWIDCETGVAGRTYRGSEKAFRALSKEGQAPHWTFHMPGSPAWAKLIRNGGYQGFRGYGEGDHWTKDQAKEAMREGLRVVDPPPPPAVVEHAWDLTAIWAWRGEKAAALWKAAHEARKDPPSTSEDVTAADAEFWGTPEVVETAAARDERVAEARRGKEGLDRTDKENAQTEARRKSVEAELAKKRKEIELAAGRVGRRGYARLDLRKVPEAECEGKAVQGPVRPKGLELRNKSQGLRFFEPSFCGVDPEGDAVVVTRLGVDRAHMQNGDVARAFRVRVHGGSADAFTGDLPIAGGMWWGIQGCRTLPSGDTWYSARREYGLAGGMLAMIGPSGSHRIAAEGRFMNDPIPVEGTEQVLALKEPWDGKLSDRSESRTLVLAEAGDVVATVPVLSLNSGSFKIVQADRERILLRAAGECYEVRP
ncbi:MAG: hypothetical protein HUU06_03970 [Planctomycetaceae bacterium]|nr:hypothetical protein [Planctomycetaceae bacterium]